MARGGGRVLSHDIEDWLTAEKPVGPRTRIECLAPRELKVLHLVASGLTTEAITAKLMNISTKTVQNNYDAIKAKIVARTDAHLVWLVVRAGLISEWTIDLSSRSSSLGTLPGR